MSEEAPTRDLAWRIGQLEVGEGPPPAPPPKALLDGFVDTARDILARMERVTRDELTELAQLVQDVHDPNTAAGVAAKAAQSIWQPRGDVLYRTVNNAIGPGLVICQKHLVELADFKFDGRSLRVRPLGVRERLRTLEPPSCHICATHRAEGNVCELETCATPLHPQWPALYCSDACALADY